MKAKPKASQIKVAHWNPTRLKTILKGLNKKNVLVIGDVGVDRYTIGDVERISPEAPVPIVLVRDIQLKLGLAANVAENVHALGGVAMLCGVVGKDRNAEDFRSLLSSAGIKTSYLVEDSSRQTVLKERIVSERQQLLRVDHESVHGIDRKVESKYLQKIQELIPQIDAIILEDYAKGTLTANLVKQVFALARKSKKWVAVDPNSKTPVSFYLGASVLTPNTREAERLSGIKIRDDASLVEAGRMILSATEAEHVVITRGKEGMAIFSKGKDQFQLIPTYAREVYDVSGAGDTVIAVMSLALAAGAEIQEAAILGNLAAGVEVGKRGTATVSPDEILVAMEFFSAVQGP